MSRKPIVAEPVTNTCPVCRDAKTGPTSEILSYKRRFLCAYDAARWDAADAKERAREAKREARRNG
jgi:hypothetical protein